MKFSGPRCWLGAYQGVSDILSFLQTPWQLFGCARLPNQKDPQNLQAESKMANTSCRNHTFLCRHGGTAFPKSITANFLHFIWTHHSGKSMSEQILHIIESWKLVQHPRIKGYHGFYYVITTIFQNHCDSIPNQMQSHVIQWLQRAEPDEYFVLRFRTMPKDMEVDCWSLLPNIHIPCPVECMDFY